jgi:hypothetical protein
VDSVEVRKRSLPQFDLSGMLNMNSQSVFKIACLLIATALVMPAESSKPVSVNGYVLDSACAFTKSLNKPISEQCAIACAKAGSPLVILADTGEIYWPIADTTPSSGQNEKMMPFAGKKVTDSGRLFQRGGSNALVIQEIKLSAK